MHLIFEPPTKWDFFKNWFFEKSLYVLIPISIFLQYITKSLYRHEPKIKLLIHQEVGPRGGRVDRIVNKYCIKIWNKRKADKFVKFLKANTKYKVLAIEDLRYHGKEIWIK